MAKINIFIPEPQNQYMVSNQRQIVEALDTLKINLTSLFNLI